MLRCSAIALCILATACVVDPDEPTDDRPGPTADDPEPSRADDDRTTSTSTDFNQRPVPAIDQRTAVEDGVFKVAIDALLANDVDPDGGRVVFMGLGNHAGVSAIVVGREVVITPEVDRTGAAWLDYIVSDGHLQATGRINIDLAAVNDAPIAYADRYDVDVDHGVDIRLAALDVDADALAVVILEHPSHGVLTGSADKYTYVPAPGWTGTDRLVYAVDDGQVSSIAVDVELIVGAD